MGPLDATGPGSLMTFDGSPVELSWVIPSNNSKGSANRQLRFAIEPIDPRTGQLLRGDEVLRYLTSPEGSMGLVKCDKTALDWSIVTQKFLYSGSDDDQIDGDAGKRFFIGFDFERSGEIVLKTYYLPSPRPMPHRVLRGSLYPTTVNMWDVDYRPLRGLLTTLDPTLIKSLEAMISYTEDAELLSKPRLQILSMDCVPNEVNRLKVIAITWIISNVQVAHHLPQLYCRPTRGSSWSDAQSAFTLGGRLAPSKMGPALARLEKLWNLLFPFANTASNRDLDDIVRPEEQILDDCHRGTSDHPNGGLLYYYSLVPGTDMVLPKIYLPVAFSILS
ncbi:hypothetical protein H0H81_001729 [Sphagnurus paluster]|uniref:Uncharacterized protein n=1 Tax=Sphagnurus paluster TaxID=117069 RepID=A0A9P7K4P0_9AGAR|nr:hypothetical protein H0H81_001729 [Sphagnurus paluster]